MGDLSGVLAGAVGRPDDEQRQVDGQNILMGVLALAAGILLVLER